jgi:hypothetical protein
MPAYSFKFRRPLDGCCSDVREIGDVDEGVVEGGEDTGNAEDELAWRDILLVRVPGCSNSCAACRYRGDRVSQSWRIRGVLPSRTWGPREMFSWGARTAAFLGAILSVFAGVVVFEIAEVVRPRKEEVASQTLRRPGGGPAELESALRCRKRAKTRACLPLLSCSSSPPR